MRSQAQAWFRKPEVIGGKLRCDVFWRDKQCETMKSGAVVMIAKQFLSGRFALRSRIFSLCTVSDPRVVAGPVKAVCSRCPRRASCMLSAQKQCSVVAIENLVCPASCRLLSTCSRVSSTVITASSRRPFASTFTPRPSPFPSPALFHTTNGNDKTLTSASSVHTCWKCSAAQPHDHEHHNFFCDNCHTIQPVAEISDYFELLSV